MDCLGYVTLDVTHLVETCTWLFKRRGWQDMLEVPALLAWPPFALLPSVLACMGRMALIAGMQVTQACKEADSVVWLTVMGTA